MGIAMGADSAPLTFLSLIKPESGPLLLATDRGALPRTRIPAPPELGQGSIEVMNLPLGIHLCRVVHQFTPGAAGLVPMSRVLGQLAEPVLFVQTLRSGRGLLHDRRLSAELAHHPQLCIFAHLDGIDHEHWGDASEAIEVTALSIGAGALNRLIGEPAAAALLRRLDIARLPSAKVRPLPPAMMAMMHACFAEHLPAGLRAVHAQARVLDFIIALFEYLVGTGGFETQRFNVARALREELARAYALPPNLDDLASRFRLSKRALNAAFRREYGQSIAGYVNDLRLDRAHAGLSSGRTPLKALAAELGFADVSHFSNAFAKRFGYRPGFLQRTAERPA